MNPNKLLLLIIVLLSISYSLAVLITASTKEAEDIPNYADYREAIGALEYGNIFDKEIGTILVKGKVRIDRIGITRVNGRRWKTLEGHLNGVKGNSTISRVLFSENLAVSDITNQMKVQGFIDNAMLKSYSTGKYFTVIPTV
ncbi:hypothetical protein ACTFIY_010107 [Dictyostelium cf. discoideum]